MPHPATITRSIADDWYHARHATRAGQAATT